MKSAILLFIITVFTKSAIADVVLENKYVPLDQDSIRGFNYLPIVLIGLFAVGILIFIYTFKKLNPK